MSHFESHNSTYFRSEVMSLIHLYIPPDIANATVTELGELEAIQFIDLNPEASAFQRPYVNEIRRLDEMSRRLRFLWQQAEKANLLIPPAIKGTPTNYAHKQQALDELDALLVDLESRILQMNESQATFNKNFLELTEIKHVLRETAEFLEEAESRRQDALLLDDAGTPIGDNHALLDHAPDVEANDPSTGLRGTHVNFIAGVIERSKFHAFQRILWRVLRGNLYMNSVEIEEAIIDPTTDAKMYKNVFLIFAHGQEILEKIRKLSNSLGATIYPVSSHPEKRREDMLEVMARLEDLNSVLFNTNATKRLELNNLVHLLSAWKMLIEKEKLVYHTMNLFIADRTRKTLIAEGWCPTEKIARIQQALTEAKEGAHGMIPSILNVIPTTKSPPTYHKYHPWLNPFQAINDAYGVAKYREVNPALFSIITFPFLFAVMFGDVGHGFFLLLVALLLCFRANQFKATAKSSEFFNMVFQARYMLVLMGIFSVYTGFMYNDLLSKSMSLFSSGYDYKIREVNNPSGSITVENIEIGAFRHAYPFGLDWAWQFADNKLVFSNSLKMKMSILFGVTHMTFATTLNVFNYLHFNDKLGILCEFLPQVLFMLSIFGYLCICIVYKWITYWPDPSKATPLLPMLINMFMTPGKVDPATQLFEGQGAVQLALVILAMICIPWMLLSKPILLKREHQRTVGYATLSHQGLLDASPSSVLHPNSLSPESRSPSGLTTTHGNGNGTTTLSPSTASTDQSNGSPHHGHGSHFNFGDTMVHQSIHTIEYCLGCISNTASYLRLWALSLAHAQLSEVLWDLAVEKILHITSPMKYILFFYGSMIWAACTIGILIAMEGLSAFLHALRLHWVEFNNKFYSGSGYPFNPFSYKEIED